MIAASTPLAMAVVPTGERTFTTFRGIKIAAKTWGREEGAKVRILALHGWLDNAGTWDLFLPRLYGMCDNPGDLYVCCIDLAGHGMSEHRSLQSNYMIALHCEDVVAVADELGWEKFVLLGHSLGGVISILSCALMPERVQSVVSIESLAPFAIPKTDFMILRDQIAYRQHRRSARPVSNKTVYSSFDAAVAARMNGFHKLSREAALPLVTRGVVRAAEAVTGPGDLGDELQEGWVWSSDARVLEPDLVWYLEPAVESFLENIECPVLVIWGDKGIKSGFNAESRERLVSDLTVKELKGGHHLHVEPAELEPVVVTTHAFLKKTVGLSAGLKAKL
ncbi:hypothetical protein HK101_001767 [Irineochytrium annulatum]|nr:hypothetical protein HK101_001767 [Irineochytrium annulatum]